MTQSKVLIFDADDTLWENNVIFERVIDDFLDWLAHPTVDRVTIRGLFDDIERANTVAHGYGSKVFLGSLADVLRHLHDRPATRAELREIERLAAALIESQVEEIAGVDETLTELGARYPLLMLTKGAYDEQRRKIEASKLEHHFAGIHIVPEKNLQTYESLLAEQSLDPALTWMIGNSPKSDILPARAAGLNAVYIPNSSTWVLEHAELDPADSGVLTVQRITDLLHHF